jgi:hypothetical protein
VARDQNPYLSKRHDARLTGLRRDAAERAGIEIGGRVAPVEL